MKLLFASGNAHKKQEIERIFVGHEILLPGELGIDFEFEEEGLTFYENSMGKAMALFNLAQKPVITDDSGICVDALDGEPGIYSARYGSDEGRLLSARERNALLLERMDGHEARSCRFVCCMTLVISPWRHYCAQETLEGILAREERGVGGFGYDPIVFLPEFGKTVAELGPEEKDEVSHRGRAGKRLLAIIDSFGRA